MSSLKVCLISLIALAVLTAAYNPANIAYVANISALQALGTASPSNRPIQVLGSQGGMFAWVNGPLPCNAKTGGGDGGATFCAGSPGNYVTTGYWQRQYPYGGPFYVNWFAASACTGSGEDTKPINAAIAAANALANSGDGPVQVIGQNCVTTGGIIPHSNVTLSLKNLTYTDANSSNWAIIYNRPATLRNFSLVDSSIHGNWSTYHEEIPNRGCLYIQAAVNITVRNLECYNLNGSIGVKIYNASSVRIVDSYFHEIAGDGVTCESCSNPVVDNNRVYHTADDAIALQLDKVVTTIGVGGTCSVSRNSIQDTYGIKLLGFHDCVVANNTSLLARAYALYVGQALTEGQTGNTGLAITGNTFYDTINNSAFGFTARNSCIWIAGFANAGAGGVIPWRSNGSTIVQPYRYSWNNAAENRNLTVPPTEGITIVGNICGRTLNSGRAYNAWGLNPSNVTDGTQAFIAAGWTNPRITDGDLRGTAVEAQGFLYDTLIADNKFAPGNVCFDFAPSASYDFWDITIRGNQCRDAVSYGLFADFAGPYVTKINVVNNEFDLDPFNVSASRGTNGTWASGSATPVGMALGNAVGVTYGANQCSNLYACWSANGNTVATRIAPDTLRGNFVGVGYNSRNAGVGVAVLDDQYIFEDSNPASKAFGSPLGSWQPWGTSAPSSGYHVAGQIMYDAAPTPLAGFCTTGWAALTTGNANRVGVDYVTLRQSCS